MSVLEIIRRTVGSVQRATAAAIRQAAITAVTTIISTNPTDRRSRLMALATPTDRGIQTEDILTVRAIARQTAAAHLDRDERPVTLPT